MYIFLHLFPFTTLNKQFLSSLKSPSAFSVIHNWPAFGYFSRLQSSIEWLSWTKYTNLNWFDPSNDVEGRVKRRQSLKLACFQQISTFFRYLFLGPNSQRRKRVKCWAKLSQCWPKLKTLFNFISSDFFQILMRLAMKRRCWVWELRDKRKCWELFYV
jgi:hypothetical protein